MSAEDRTDPGQTNLPESGRLTGFFSPSHSRCGKGKAAIAFANIHVATAKILFLFLATCSFGDCAVGIRISHNSA